MEAKRNKIRHLSWLYVIIAAMVMSLIVGCSNSDSVTKNVVAQSEKTNNNKKSSAIKGDTRTVKDAYGEVEVPTQASRIVVLDIGALDNLLEMGITPVGAPSILKIGDPYPAYLKGTKGIENIGSVNEPNLERIHALKPDLILGNKDTHDAIHVQLKQIAPTVFVETLGVTWKENLQLHAEAVNKQNQGTQLLRTYQDRIDKLKSGLAGKKAKQISLIRPREDKIQVYLKETFAGTVMNDAGIARPASQQGDGFSKDITEEQITDLDGDLILWFNREPDAFDKLSNRPLWSTLQAVQQHAVQPVDWEYWMSGLGIQAVNKIIDDLNRFLIH
ncbi:iron complex transport system substrate-binding protein [Paenibacillus shirakamiensis]|uniref:Iron complex transport system substrate-binding protein n=1 Tax=Paenibacillus shirakamiensis TaxID=1265935 RepID=A0ABS4JE31_9BACL|nr:iron-siderophore ABC transporter substrate-binding protein [Paenibacillus shirakamiensis]MBP1999969.1 iron complex transport system substrate-binding protein [Paenibacillus shirakamiensis]